MKNFLRQTPTVQKQKWFLTAFLFAALGSNYYFQATSLDKGHFEMSSEKDAVKIQATAVAVPCSDCDKVQLTQSEYKSLKALAEKVQALEAEKVKIEAEKNAETPQEKSARLKEEKENAKKEKEKAKKEKEKEAKLARKEEFVGKMAEEASDCAGDVKCSTKIMINLLDHYSGKNKIDAPTVLEVFNQYIAKDLKAALKNPESAEVTLEALQQLGLDIPTDYRFLKEKTVDIMKNDALLKGFEVNRNFKMADALNNAKRTAEAERYFAKASQQRDQLTNSSNLMYQTTVQALQESRDWTTMEYIRNTYLPDMSKMISNLSNVNGLENVFSGTTNPATLNQPNQTGASTRNNSRLDTSVANPLNSNTPINDQKVQTPQNLLNGVTIGKPTSEKRLNRGAVQ